MPHRFRPKCCPACGAEQVVPILYGLPTLEAFEQAQRGELELGGCCVTFNAPIWHCKACAHRWHAKRKSPLDAL